MCKMGVLPSFQVSTRMMIEMRIEFHVISLLIIIIIFIIVVVVVIIVIVNI